MESLETFQMSKPPNRGLTEKITFRLSPDERDDLEAAALKANHPPSEEIRVRCFGKKEDSDA
jgi:hypothetical protein